MNREERLAYYRNWSKTHLAYFRAYQKAHPRNKTEYNRKRRSEKNPVVLANDRRNSAIQRIRHPEKVKARLLVARAIQKGLILKPTNCSCGNSGRIEGHHWNGYENALDVKWFCVPCHKDIHRSLKTADGKGE